MDFYGDSTRWFVGTVVDVTDPLKLDRVKVRVHGCLLYTSPSPRDRG